MTERHSAIDSDVHRAAAHWYARMSSDGKLPADQAAFDDWIASAPEHAEAFAETCAVAARFDKLAHHRHADALRIEALRFDKKRWWPAPTPARAFQAAAGLAAAAAAVTFFFVSPIETGAWTTARGETRNIVLSDGSEVVVGPNSSLSVRFYRGTRDLELERGQAFFEVARDADRPFRVAVGERTVTALGTAFDVRSELNATTVTLVHGSVRIGRNGGSRHFLLKPGQQFHVALGKAFIRSVDAAAETSWHTGMLDFQNVPLSGAVAQFNRNAMQSLVIADGRLSDFRVSGVFRANDPQGFAAALAPAFPITATQRASGDIVLSYRADRTDRAGKRTSSPR